MIKQHDSRHELRDVEFKESVVSMQNHTVLIKQHGTKHLYTKTLGREFTHRFIYFGLTIYILFFFNVLKGFCQRRSAIVDKVGSW